MKSFKLTKSKIGVDKWPFTVDEVVIQVDDISAIYVKIGKKKYNLNGIAKEGRPLIEIWADFPGINYEKKPFSFIFRMCQEKGWF